MSRRYPEWVCMSCVNEIKAEPVQEISTWHIGLCGVCKRKKPVTEPRDFGYPDFIRFKRNK